MKKHNIMPEILILKSFFLAVIFTIIFTGALFAASNSPLIKQAEGKFIKAEIGTDSCAVYIVDENGKNIFLKITPSTDWMSAREYKEYEKAKNTLPGKKWPTIADTASRVRAWYIDGAYKFLIKYEVLSAPKALWFVIAASASNEADAAAKKSQAHKQGYYPDIIKSSDFPKLKPGYYIIVLGAFENAPDAQKYALDAKYRGFKDAYAKQAR